jgi:hypothetical protein
LDPFQFVVALVGIATAGGIVTTIVKTIGAAYRRPPAPELKAGPTAGETTELEHLREAIDHMSGRVAHLEEERDFYKELLEPAKARGAIKPPEAQYGAAEP